MNNRSSVWQLIFVKLKECVQDERGSAMTEYLLISGIMIPIAAYLFSPDTGFCKEFREEYDATTFVLMYPGP
jgi:hypothetical protein